MVGKHIGRIDLTIELLEEILRRELGLTDDEQIAHIEIDAQWAGRRPHVIVYIEGPDMPEVPEGHEIPHVRPLLLTEHPVWKAMRNQ